MVLSSRTKRLRMKEEFNFFLILEVPQCSQTVASSSHVDVDHYIEFIISNNTEDDVPLQNEYDNRTSGLENGIIRHLPNNFIPQKIKLIIGIDGLPISKSTSTQFWPILVYLRPNSNLVFSVGLYCGTDKHSDSNEYLKYLLNEDQHLITNGPIVLKSAYSE
ncbi:Uncharacterized protein FWK35_00012794 [Aphis craccivora]|uniref:Uncharacterized protein n=1 Tax=Aphis craccivora TaxID=307492 RepID=A0A6G0Y8P8_APHCR|nr:Uncharacterized protein FWK35_00012794 [Aphis craccivora]